MEDSARLVYRNFLKCPVPKVSRPDWRPLEWGGLGCDGSGLL